MLSHHSHHSHQKEQLYVTMALFLQLDKHIRIWKNTRLKNILLPATEQDFSDLPQLDESLTGCLSQKLMSLEINHITPPHCSSYEWHHVLTLQNRALYIQQLEKDIHRHLQTATLSQQCILAKKIHTLPLCVKCKIADVLVADKTDILSDIEDQYLRRLECMIGVDIPRNRKNKYVHLYYRRLRFCHEKIQHATDKWLRCNGFGKSLPSRRTVLPAYRLALNQNNDIVAKQLKQYAKDRWLIKN